LTRLAPTALVLGLLGATATAFAVAERLKLEPTPILKTRVTRIFSPTCDCRTNTAYINFRLRKADDLTVLIADSSGDAVRHLARHEAVAAGPASFVWDGRDDDGAVVPDGFYAPRVHLEHSNRTFDLPNRIRLDATAPRIVVDSLHPRTISPDRDGRADDVRIRYHVDEPAVVRLFVDGVQRVLVRGKRTAGAFDWNGRIGGVARPGRYRLTLVARDLAGNLSTASGPFILRVRYVMLAPSRLHVIASNRFGVRVDTDARSVVWKLGARHGRLSPRGFVLRAPARPGRYTLMVSVGDHVARIPVFVRAAPLKPR
jgi:hypothetical protein